MWTSRLCPFVQTILETLQGYASLRRGVGLYIGCGNGRNYLPLVDAGLELIGLDLSPESLRQLTKRRPACADRLRCMDVRAYAAEKRLSYIIAIQVLQHGTEADVVTYFAKVRTLLQPGGLFFLRVNAASTHIDYPHTVVDRNAFGGLTIRYEAGPKQGLPVHFYSYDELVRLTEAAFEPVLAPREERIMRRPPQTGFWTQWEAIWQKQDRT
jgi:SAM-dependent methyltransferase